MGIFDSLGSVSEGIKGLGPGFMSRLFTDVNFAPIWTFMKVFFYFAVVVVGGMLLWQYYLRFNIKITVKRRLGGGGSIEVFEDRARILIDEQRKKKLVLMKSRAGKEYLTCPVPEGKYRNKKGRWDHYELWRDDNDQLHPVESPMLESGQNPELAVQMRVRPQERDAWRLQEHKRMEEKYRRKDLLEKWAPMGIMVVAMITAFLIWFFATRELGNGLVGVAQQIAQLASSCQIG